jgi:hypothetical protein
MTATAADAQSPLHSFDLKEVRKPRAYGRDLERVVQLHPHPQDASCYACNGGKRVKDGDVVGRLRDVDGRGSAEDGAARTVQEKRILKKNWFSIVTPPEDCPGIYEWKIDGEGVYVGKAKRLATRMRAYPNNVRKILNKVRWRAGSDRDFRAVHHALHKAHESGATVTFSVLEICVAEFLNERERYWIGVRKAEELQTGLKVLNSN